MLNGYFRLKEKQTNVRTEVLAGITTFLTMAYIIFVNPDILSKAGMDTNALIIVTCLVSAAATIGTGVFTNAPIAMAPGMGLNAFLTYSLVKAGKTDWQTALGIVFLASLLCTVLTLLGLRKKLVEAIPQGLIAAIAVGIGLFITFIGLVNMGIIVNNEDTLISAGPIKNTVLIALAGLLIMAFLEVKKIKGALLAGIIASSLLAAVFRLVPAPEKVISFNLNVSAVAFKLDIRDAFEWGLLGSIFTLMFMDLFDSIGTLVACCHEAKMEDENGKIRGLDRLLGIDASASMLGAALGSSTITSYIESAAGIEEGGRTGLTAIVCGVCFLLAIPFAPLVSIVPSFATGPALVMVGLFMIREVKRIDFSNLEEGFPAFIIMIMIALSYSISTGLAFGFLSYVVIKIFKGKAREIKITMWIIALLCLVFMAIGAQKMKINITSTAFKDGAMLPAKYTCDGQNVSPPLKWDSVPEGTKSIAIICEDPDAPSGLWVHWVLFNLPPDCNELAENFPDDETLSDGSRQGITDFQTVGYGGPCPPWGTHRYLFKIYALDCSLDIVQLPDRNALLSAMKGRILAEGLLTGKYQRTK